MFCSSKTNARLFQLCVCVVLAVPTQLFADSLSSLEDTKYQMSLDSVLKKVRKNDLTLLRFGIVGDAYRAEAEASDYFPDPVIFVAAQNVPTDTFDFDQEAMTQFRVGIRQMLPKGESLEIAKDISLIHSGRQSIEQQIRWKNLKLKTETAWLEAWYWQKNKQLVEDGRVYLTQVKDFIQSLYQVGAKGQSDLIGAQLELIKLDERQLEADQKYNHYRHELNTLANERLLGHDLGSELTKLNAFGIDISDESAIKTRLLQHPELRVLDAQVEVFEKKVSLAEQAFAPSWGLELSYGMRGGENADGSNRADLLTAGVNVQFPLFTKGKQNSELSAARYQQQSIENTRSERLHKMHFQLENVHHHYMTTVTQRQLYEKKILPTLSKQKNSSLNSYESDQGDFRAVTELFIKELSTKIKHQRLKVDEQIMIARMHYWIGVNDEQSNQALMGALVK